MSNELAKIDFNAEQLQLIKSQIAKDATNDELALFLNQCKRTGLDPLTRQIYFMKRGGKMTIQTSIDGFRVIAERSGDYAGQDEPTFEHDGNTLTKATVKVYRFRNDVRYCAAVGVAYWSEYVPQQGQDFMWKKMPHTMLAKVAEALALRKAYPQDLSGLYTNDEMQEAAAPTQDADFSNVPDQDELKLLRDLVYSSTLSEEHKEAAFTAIEKVTSYEMYEKLRHKLEDVQPSIDNIPNPSQTDIKKHLKKVTAVA